MSEPKDSTSFFRKVVKFVANPATDWNDIQSPQPELREQEFAKSELKAMIERKRRNDFVRKREFDMLRRVRREGLTSDQLAALGGSSRLDDSESRMAENGARQDGEVKAKIDAIEQQMVGDGTASPSRRHPAPPVAPPLPAAGTDFYNATTKPVLGLHPPLQRSPAVRPDGSGAQPAARAAPGRDAPLLTEVVSSDALQGLRPNPADPVPLQGLGLGSGSNGLEISEIAYDPELDEAVIAFANADFTACEQSLALLTASHGARAHHADTWLVLFDLYRAVGQQHKFEALANEYAQQFGWSAPQWFSLPQLVADASAEQRSAAGSNQAAGWSSPAHLDREAIGHLAGRALQMPLPWVLEWSALRSIDAEACARLTDLFRGWALQPIDMRWLGGETLFHVLRDASPAGVRDVDPAVWRLRLEALRLANRADQFDEAAIDYCVTYEVSPPSWERAQCKVKVGAAGSSQLPSSVMPGSEPSSGFAESQMSDGATGPAHCELSGQLTGDITALLHQLTLDLGTATGVQVSCARLIRVDFIAAGDLLNWVLSRKAENRQVTFTDANRLVALFFGAMGINEHAHVRVRST